VAARKICTCSKEYKSDVDTDTSLFYFVLKAMLKFYLDIYYAKK